MICGHRGIIAPPPNPNLVLRASGQAGFLGGLSDDLLMDVHNAHIANGDRANRVDCHALDVIRAEFARRHAPTEDWETRRPNCELA